MDNPNTGGKSEQSVRPVADADANNPSHQHVDVVVIGGGPGGYTAAFRAADLGKKIVLIEREQALGGVCLHVGCIPSKALLHIAQIINETKAMASKGISFGKPDIDLGRIRAWKGNLIKRMAKGLAGLASQRKVPVIQGEAKFVTNHKLVVHSATGDSTITFDHAIIATGSRPVRVPSFPDDKRLLDSTSALALTTVPNRLLVIGGGIIGLEMATFFDALGTKITVVELQDSLIPGCDADLVKPLSRIIRKRYASILLSTRVTKIEPVEDGLKVYFDGVGAPADAVFDQVLVAVGRSPNGHFLGAENAGVAVTEAGFISVDDKQQTNQSHIFAIGDITGNPMLAHKAIHAGKVAAEVIGGLPAVFSAKAIPAVAYTDPEIAWMGLTEEEAKARNIEVETGAFPWIASGRSLSLGRSEGLTKILFDPTSKRILGAGIVGPNAGELIAEAVLAMEMGADSEDLSLIIHPHPTLSETLGLAAEMALGTATDLYQAKSKVAD